MIKLKVIAGCQDGADLAGLKAAKICGIPTGGWAPPYFTNSSGRHPEYADLYGAKALDPKPFLNLMGEIDEQGWKQAYRQRTILNVQMSHGVVFFGNCWSPGGRLTLTTAESSSVPHYVVVNSDYHGGDGEPTLENWIRGTVMTGEENPCLMIAGNRPDRFLDKNKIEIWAYEYLVRMFKALLEK